MQATQVFGQNEGAGRYLVTLETTLRLSGKLEGESSESSSVWIIQESRLR